MRNFLNVRGQPNFREIAEPVLKKSKKEKGIDDLFVEDLEAMKISELYDLIHEHLDQRSVVDTIRGNIGFRKALVIGWLEAIAQHRTAGTKDHRIINSRIMKAEAGFIRRLKELGVYVDVQSEIRPEEFDQQPYVFMPTHQGGAVETYLAAEMMRQAGVKQFRYVMKDELVNLPIVGPTIASRAPIIVRREKLLNKATEKEEIQKVAREIVEALVGGESVLYFFEGTRSKSGEIAHTEKRKQWHYDLSDAIAAEAAKYPNLKFGKALVVLDMLSVLPEAVEKKLNPKIRTNGDCTLKIVRADHLENRENPENPYDVKTFFGKARSVLKEVLIDRILHYKTSYL